MTKLLSEDDVATYRERGYHFPVNALSESEVTGFRGKLEDYEAESGGPIKSRENHGPMAPIWSILGYYAPTGMMVMTGGKARLNLISSSTSGRSLPARRSISYTNLVKVLIRARCFYRTAGLDLSMNTTSSFHG